MKNKYEIHGDITVVYVKSSRYGDRQFIIDTEDLEKIKSLETTWFVSASSIDTKWVYFRAKAKKATGKPYVLLHRFIMDCPDDKFVDHINHDTLDNRKSNLRIVSKQQNNLNLQGARKDNKSTGVRGVYFNRRINCWSVSISYHNNSYQLGTYDNVEDAKQVANCAIELTSNLDLDKKYVQTRLLEMEKRYKRTRASKINKHSRVRNVWYDKRYSIWYVVIQKNKKVYRFGGFKNMDEAVKLAETLRNKDTTELDMINKNNLKASE